MKLHKNMVLNENQIPVAVQIPIAEFELIEEIIENYGLAKLMDETINDERLTAKSAKSYYKSLKKNVEN